MDMFTEFFSNPKALLYLQKNIELALNEDGEDKASNAVFSASDVTTARIVAKSPLVLAGIHFIPYIFTAMKECGYADTVEYTLDIQHNDGTKLTNENIAYITAPLRVLLKAERVILNYIIHLSGIASLTRKYADIVQNTSIQILDTRKTIPGMRYPEKYAVRVGGGFNHRMDLEEMILIKDTYIDYIGTITKTVETIRNYYNTTCPPIIIECRTIKEVVEAISCKPKRIMLDNMDYTTITESLYMIPENIETEITGGITLDTLPNIVDLPKHPNYVSVGAITHSTQSVDCSMYIVSN